MSKSPGRGGSTTEYENENVPPPSYSETQQTGAGTNSPPPTSQIFIQLPPPPSQPPPIVQKNPKECCCGFTKCCCIVTWSVCGVFTLLALIGIGVLLYFLFTSIAGYDCKCDLASGCRKGESPANDAIASKCAKFGPNCDLCTSLDESITESECFEKRTQNVKCIGNICYCSFVECKGYLKCGTLCCTNTGKNNTKTNGG